MTRLLRRLLCGALLLTLAPLAWAKTTNYRIASGEGKVAFSISHLTNTANGKFGKFDGQLHFSKDKPETSSVQVSVDTASIDTDNSSRDKSLRGAEYFAVADFPSMTFQSKGFRKVGPDKYLVTGPIVVKGHSKNISVPVTLGRTGTTWATGEEILRFQGSFEIDRTEFGVGEASSLLGSVVTVKLDLEFRGAK